MAFFVLKIIRNLFIFLVPAEENRFLSMLFPLIALHAYLMSKSLDFCQFGSKNANERQRNLFIQNIYS